MRRLFVYRLLRCCTLLFLYCSLHSMAIAQTEQHTDTVVDVEEIAPTEDVAAPEEKYEETIPDTASLRSVPAAHVQELKKSPDFEYANDPAYWNLEKKDANKTRSYSNSKSAGDEVTDFLQIGPIRWIFYLLAAFLLLLILYRIAVVNNLLTPWGKKRLQPENEGMPNEIDDRSLPDKIQEAIAAGDYRLATRYLYLKTLQGLNEKGLIRYHAEATNNQYIDQLKSHPAAKDFRWLTRIYEYVWYGEFLLNEAQFAKVNHSFQQFYSTERL